MPPSADAGPRQVRVTVDGGVLHDGRATAGIGRYTRSLCAALRERPDVELSVSHPRRAALGPSRPLRFLRAQPAVLVTGHRRHADVVHAVSGEPALAWPASRQVATVHDLQPWTDPAGRGGRLAAAYLGLIATRLRRCAAVIAVSEGVAADAIATLRLDPTRVHVVPEGVGPTFSAVHAATDAARRQALGADVDVPYILWTGSLVAHDPRKALDVLLDAVAQAAYRVDGLRLVAAGQSGEEAERLRRRAAALGLTLVLPGYVSDGDLAALHRGAAASVVASLHEGFGLPVLEALACGAPLVATLAGNIPALAADAARLVAPGDVTALADALVETVVTPAGEELRRRGPARAAQFTWARTAAETAAVYRKAAGILAT